MEDGRSRAAKNGEYNLNKAADYTDLPALAPASALAGRFHRSQLNIHCIKTICEICEISGKKILSFGLILFVISGFLFRLN